jgi:hypothetical protein
MSGRSRSGRDWPSAAFTVLVTSGYAATISTTLIVRSTPGNALTVSVKTFAGTDPSGTNPFQFLFRNVTGSVGSYTVRTVTGALGVTVPSGQAVGFVNATPGRLWVGAVDNAGTVELFVVNAATLNGTVGGQQITGIYALQGWGITTTTAIATAPSAGVPYSTTARTNVPYVTLGYMTWETGSTLATAGTWNAVPSRSQVYQAGTVPLPGQVVQTQRTATGASTTGSTVIPFDDTIPQITEGNEYMTQAITPISSANALAVSAHIIVSTSVAGQLSAALFQDATANALAAATTSIAASTSGTTFRLSLFIQAGTVSATTFRTRAGQNNSNTTTFNGSGGTRLFGGITNSFMEASEIMG